MWLDKKVFEGERGLAKKVAKEIADMRKLGLLTTHALPSAADVHDGQVRPDHPTLFSSGPGGAVGASLVKRASEVRASPAGLTTEAALGFAYGLPSAARNAAPGALPPANASTSVSTNPRSLAAAVPSWLPLSSASTSAASARRASTASARTAAAPARRKACEREAVQGT